MEAVFGMHKLALYPAGTLAGEPGPVMAAASFFRVVVHGVGGHAAAAAWHRPGAGGLPAGQRLAEHRQPQHAAHRHRRAVGDHAACRRGAQRHPETCEIQGTVRSFRDEVLDLVERRMRQIAEHSCAGRARCEFEFHRRAPAVVNHRREAEFAARVMAQIVGAERIAGAGANHGLGDFAFMLQAKAGAYCFIGNGDGAHRERGHGDGRACCTTPATTSTTR